MQNKKQRTREGKTNTTQAQTTESKPATKIQEGPKTRREVKFSAQSGKFFVHPSLMHDDCHQPCDETRNDVLHQHCDKIDPPSSLPTDHLHDNPCEDDPACYVWRSQDYSFLPVRPPHQVNQTFCSFPGQIWEIFGDSLRFLKKKGFLEVPKIFLDTQRALQEHSKNFQ